MLRRGGAFGGRLGKVAESTKTCIFLIYGVENSFRKVWGCPKALGGLYEFVSSKFHQIGS